MSYVIPTTISDRITVVDGQLTTTTQDIAEVYCKRHDDVIRIVRKRIAEAGEWGIRNFTDTHYTNPQNGQTYPIIRMTKKGFHFVVGKFTGSKAVTHQIAFADEFERMEIQLRDAVFSCSASPTLAVNDADMLRELIQHHSETLARHQRADFIINAWRKLKDHFGVNYRQIPAECFTEAISVIGQYIAEFRSRTRPEEKDDPPEELIARWFEPNSYPFDHEFLYRLAQTCMERIWHGYQYQKLEAIGKSAHCSWGLTISNKLKPAPPLKK